MVCASSLLDLVPVVPVVVIEDAADAVPLARALVAGGPPAIEVTLRTPAALDAIRAVADAVPDAMVGAGTVVTPEQVAGGTAYLRSLAGPLPQARLCPTGGIGPGDAPEYLSLPNVGCVGGTWMLPADAVAARDWRRVEALAREAAALSRPWKAQRRCDVSLRSRTVALPSA